MEPEVTETAPNGMESVSEEVVSGENPAWQELYGILPDNLHGLVAPVLKKWETGTQSKFEANAAEQLAYAPYKQFLDGNVGSDQIEQALAVAQLIDSDPKAFMSQMQAYFGDDTSTPPVKEVVAPPVDEEDLGFEDKPYDLTADPNFKKMMEQQDTIAGYLAKEVETKRAAQEDATLVENVKKYTDTYGAFDEDYVFGLVMNDVPMEDAVKKYHALVETIRTKPAADAGLPNILTPGGGLPSEKINPADMTKEQRMAFVMNTLAQANTT